MTQSTKPISPLRQRMIDDMTLRKLSPKPQKTYIRAVKNFTRFFGQSPDAATAEDLRRYQLHLVQQGISSGTLNATLTGLRFFFEITLDRPGTMKHTSHVHQPRKGEAYGSVRLRTRRAASPFRCGGGCWRRRSDHLDYSTGSWKTVMTLKLGWFGGTMGEITRLPAIHW